MGYNISRFDVDTACTNLLTFNGQLSESLDSTSSAIESLVGQSAFQGGAADSIKAYFSEMHLSICMGLVYAINEFAMRYAEYSNGYDSFESAHNAVLKDSTLSSVSSTFQSTQADFQSKVNELNSIVSSIQDIIDISTPSAYNVLSGLGEIQHDVQSLNVSTAEHEAYHANSLLQVYALIEVISQMINSLASYSAGATYRSGDIASQPWAKEFASLVVASANYQQAHQAQFEKAVDGLKQRTQIRQEEAAAAAARDEGFWQIATAIFDAALIAGGVVLCIATCGVATPLVAAAVVVTSTLAAAYVASEIVEGSQKIITGNSHVFNPIRDTVFGGNQNVYNFFREVAYAAPTLVVPIGAAAAASNELGKGVTKQSVKTALKNVAKETTTEVAKDVGKSTIIDIALQNTVDVAIDKSDRLSGAGKEALKDMTKKMVSFEISAFSSAKDVADGDTLVAKKANFDQSSKPTEKIVRNAYQEGEWTKAAQEATEEYSKIRSALKDKTESTYAGEIGGVLKDGIDTIAEKVNSQPEGENE